MLDKLIIFAGIAMVGLAPDQYTEKDPGLVDPPAVQSESVDAGQDFYRRMTVPVHIDGKGPFNFMVDTGSQVTVVTRKLDQTLGFAPMGSATVVGIASSKRVDMVQVNGLQFASKTFDNLRAPILEEQDIGADGILGLDSLQGLRVVIDFRNNRMEVADASMLGGNRGYEIVVRAKNKLGRLIITQARIDGVKTEIVVDTGAEASIGNSALLAALKGKKLSEVIATDVHGNQLAGDLRWVNNVKLGRMSLKRIPVAFADGPAFAALGLDDRPALILGMHDLRLFERVAIDFSSSKILFDIPEAYFTTGTILPPRRRRSD